MPRKAINEIVLAAMRLVSNDDDIPAVREHRVPVPRLLREELLNRREHNAAGCYRQLGAQIGTVDGLHRRLTQQITTSSERAEKLIVEVVAIGNHDDRRVLHLGMQDHTPRIEGHRQALAGTLRVPDNPNPAVARMTTINGYILYMEGRQHLDKLRDDFQPIAIGIVEFDG